MTSAPGPGCAKRQRDEIVLAVIDAEIGAQPLALRGFLIRSGGDDDARAERLGERNRRGADAGGSAVHQQGFAAFSAPRAKTFVQTVK